MAQLKIDLVVDDHGSAAALQQTEAAIKRVETAAASSATTITSRSAAVVNAHNEQSTSAVKAASSYEKLSAGAAMFARTAGAMLTGNVLFSIGNGLADMARSSFQAASDLVDLSAKTGLTTETLQRLALVGSTAGVSIEAFSNASFMLGVNLQKTGATQKKMAADVAELGLSYENLRAMTPDQQFMAIAGALGSMENAQERNRIGAELFGKSFKAIVPAITADFAEMARTANVASDDQVRALDELGDAWSTFVKNREADVTSMLGSMVILAKGAKQAGFFEIMGAWFKGGVGGATAVAAGAAFSGSPAVTAPPGKPPGSAGTSDPDSDREADRIAAARKREAEAWAKEINRLSGSEAVKAANDWMKKVEQIGGVTRLAAKDQKTYNETLGEAIEAMSRAGKSIDPKMMQAFLNSFQGPAIHGGIPVTGIGPNGNPLGLPGVDVGKPVAPIVPLPNIGVTPGLPGLPGIQQALPNVTALIALADGKVAALRNNLGTLARAFDDVGQSATAGLGQALSGIGNLFNTLQNVTKMGSAGVASALFSGDTTLSAKWAAGIQSASAIAAGAMSVWNSTANDGSKAAGALHGALGGAQAGAMFGPWGAAIGAAGGALLGFIHTLSAGRRAVEDFASSFDTAAAGSGFDELHAKMSKLGDEGERLWIKLTQQTGKGDKAGAARVIDEINNALKTQSDNDPAAQAAAAGFETTADLQLKAQQAQAVYEFMKNSGSYSAMAVQQAWERANAALIASGDQTALAAQQANAQIAELDGRIKGLQASIANEAPEEVMGVIEQQTRAQIAALEAQRAAATSNIDAIKNDLQPLIDGGITIPIHFRPDQMPVGGDGIAGPHKDDTIYDENGNPVGHGGGGDTPDHYHSGGLIGWRRMHRGGLASDEIPIIGQRGEFMMSRRGVAANGVNTLRRMNAGETVTGGSGGEQMMTIVIEQDGDATARFILPYVAREARRLGLFR